MWFFFIVKTYKILIDTKETCYLYFLRTSKTQTTGHKQKAIISRHAERKKEQQN